MSNNRLHRFLLIRVRRHVSFQLYFDKIFIILSLAFLLVLTPMLFSYNVFALTDPVVVPYVNSSKVIVDGIITQGEYKGTYTNPPTGVSVYWEQDGQNILVGLVSKGTGWVSIGFGPKNTGMDGSNILIGFVDDSSGVLTLSDELGVGYEHYSDESRGGKDNIVKKAGTQDKGITTIEFVVPLNSGDVNDQVLQIGETYGFFLGYHKTADDFKTYHSDHSASLTLTIQNPKDVSPKDDVPKEPPKPTSLKLSFHTVNVTTGDNLHLSAKLTDLKGVSMAKAVIVFYVNSTFGDVKVGSNVSDSNGVANILFIHRINGTLAIKSEYLGDETHSPSTDTGYLNVFHVQSKENDPLFWVFDFTKGIIVLVIGSVWTVYAFVLYQIGGIAKNSSTRIFKRGYQ